MPSSALFVLGLCGVNVKGSLSYNGVRSHSSSINSIITCFQNVFDPLMRLSMKLQKPESNVSESRDWVKYTINLLEDLKSG